MADIPITTPEFWTKEEECTEDLLKHVFRSATEEEIPLLKERLQCLQEAGRVLCRVRNLSVSCGLCLVLMDYLFRSMREAF